MKKSIITLIALAGVTYAGPYTQFPEITEGSVVRSDGATGGHIITDFIKRSEENGSVTYLTYRHASTICSPDIRNGQIDVADGVDFYTKSATNVYGTGELHISNTKVYADDVYFLGSTDLRNYDNMTSGRCTEVYATNITLREDATVQLNAWNAQGQVKLQAENRITVDTSGYIQKADFIADTISLRTAESVGKSNFEAREIVLLGADNIYHSNIRAEEKITLSDTTINLHNGYTIAAPVIELQSGKIASAGNIEGELLVTGGTYTMVNGAVAGALTATSGVINLSGNVTFTGDLNLGAEEALLSVDSPLAINITQGATLTLEDVAMHIAEGVVFNVKLTGDALLDENETLFTIDFGSVDVEAIEEQLSKVATTLSYGNEVVESFEPGLLGISTSGAVSVVPEPTTATLSLLALAGLAARRRRK